MALIDNKAFSYYDVFPKIVPCNKIFQIKITPRAVLPFDDSLVYILVVRGKMKHDEQQYRIMPNKGTLILNHTFLYEQEYTIAVIHMENEILLPLDILTLKFKKEIISIVSVYCLEEDLLHLRPYKGDFHFHSQRSDGDESPAGMCAYARKEGLDFMGLTDHNNYNASLEAIASYEDVNLNMKLFPGEELTTSQVHMISFGGDYGLSEDYSQLHNLSSEVLKERDKFYASIQSDLDKLPKGISPEQYGQVRFLAHKIKNAGGVSIFCHPFWSTRKLLYQLTEPFTRYYLEHGEFDALELLSGDTGDTNSLQISLWQEMKSMGISIPIVTGSDTHTALDNPFFGEFYTLVFVKDLKLPSLIEAIKSQLSVVVLKSKSKVPLVFGSFRLTAYALFLFREVLPLHDELCREEGNAMFNYLLGDQAGKKKLDIFQGQIERYYRKVYSSS